MSQLFTLDIQSTGASATVLPVNILGLIFFRIDWFDLLAVEGTLQNLLQHHNSTASILQHSAFFIVQLSHQYMTTGKTIALIIQTFVSKLMSLLFNTLPRFVIALLPRSNCLNFMAAVTNRRDFTTQENKICHCFYFFPFYLPSGDGTGCHDVSFFTVEFQVSFFTVLFHPHQEVF